MEVLLRAYPGAARELFPVCVAMLRIICYIRCACDSGSFKWLHVAFIWDMHASARPQCLKLSCKRRAVDSPLCTCLRA
eukprot:4598040-Pleurochrysis_carterae.AAC.5